MSKHLDFPEQNVAGEHEPVRGGEMPIPVAFLRTVTEERGIKREGGREGEWERGMREGGREGGREGWRKGTREGGREGEREGGRKK